MTGKPNVYVVNHSDQHDFDQAKQFGVLKPITQGNVDIFKVDRLLWHVRENMKDYTNNDFILMCGHSLINFIVITEAFTKVDKVKILIFGAKYRDYYLMELRREFWENKN